MFGFDSGVISIQQTVISANFAKVTNERLLVFLGVSMKSFSDGKTRYIGFVGFSFGHIVLFIFLF